MNEADSVIEWKDNHISMMSDSVEAIQLYSLADVGEYVSHYQENKQGKASILTAYGIVLFVYQYEKIALEEVKNQLTSACHFMNGASSNSPIIQQVLNRMSKCIYKCKSANEARTTLFHEAIKIQIEWESSGTNSYN
jgi:methylthioribose-1-phosphate isomerase